MSKIYEIDKSLFSKIEMYPTYDKFIFTSKRKRDVVVVDNTSGDFFTEDFSNKTKGLIYLVNDSFLPNDVEQEYKKNKDKYKNYHTMVSSQNDYMFDKDLYDRDFCSFDPNKKYEFDINIGYGKETIKATIKDALGLASNHESDLVYNERLLFSPLGFDWNYNNKLIHKYLGIKNISDKGIELPYRYMDSPEIEVLKKEIKI